METPQGRHALLFERPVITPFPSAVTKIKRRLDCCHAFYRLSPGVTCEIVIRRNNNRFGR